MVSSYLLLKFTDETEFSVSYRVKSKDSGANYPNLQSKWPCTFTYPSLCLSFLIFKMVIIITVEFRMVKNVREEYLWGWHRFYN